MAVAASVALMTAKALLGDPKGINWNDIRLFPLLQQATRELALELRKNNVRAIQQETAGIIVPANTENLFTAGLQPSDLVAPIDIIETSLTNPLGYIPVIYARFLPKTTSPAYLTYWSWFSEQLRFLPATGDRYIIIRYKKFLDVPKTATDLFGINMAELYVGPRIAGMAMDSIDKDGSVHNNSARANIYSIISSCVTEDQRPVRRRGYRSRRFLYTGDAGTIPSGGSGGGILLPTWILPNNLPDGIATVFFFNKIPLRCSYNGLLQFLGVGYTLDLTGGTIKVSFIDSFGATITPTATDDVRAEVI